MLLEKWVCVCTGCLYSWVQLASCWSRAVIYQTLYHWLSLLIHTNQWVIDHVIKLQVAQYSTSSPFPSTFSTSRITWREACTVSQGGTLTHLLLSLSQGHWRGRGSHLSSWISHAPLIWRGCGAKIYVNTCNHTAGHMASSTWNRSSRN